MGFSFVLRDNQNKRMRGILLREGKKNSAGNVIILSVTLAGNQRVILGAFTLLLSLLPSSHLTSQTPIPIRLSFINLVHLSLPCLPTQLSALNHLFCSSATPFSLVSLPPPLPTPCLLYTKVSTVLPTTHRTNLKFQPRFYPASPPMTSITHQSSTPALHSSQTGLRFPPALLLRFSLCHSHTGLLCLFLSRSHVQLKPQLLLSLLPVKPQRALYTGFLFLFFAFLVYYLFMHLSCCPNQLINSLRALNYIEQSIIFVLMVKMTTLV